MTIHSEWAKIFYQECPDAFVDALKYNKTSSKAPKWDVGVIDGHLQLMCLNERMVSWDRFIQVMFVSPINQMFKQGCPTVVVCFDSYEHVPIYKNMTQLRRTQGRAVCTFDAAQDLPSRIPNDVMKYLMNRHFKVKVIQMLCQRLPHFISLEDHQEFIIDYKKVVSYNKSSFSKISVQDGGSHEHWAEPVPVSVSDLQPMGESDVKFTRYTQKYGNSLIHAIDGDYMIISLLYYAQHGVRNNNKIYIYRQRQKGYEESSSTVVESHPHSWSDRRNESQQPPYVSSADDEDDDDLPKKQEAVDLEHAFHAGVSMAADSVKKRQKTSPTGSEPSRNGHRDHAGGVSSFPHKKNKKCWVDMQMVYVSLLEAFRQSKSSYHQPAMDVDSSTPMHDDREAHMRSNENDSIRAIVFLILCAGTDFSRQLPLIGPMRLWENIPVIADYLVMAVKARDTDMIMDVCIAKLYKTIFSKHVGGVSGRSNLSDWICTRRNLLSSSLSKSTKDKFPEKDCVVTMIKNIFWVMHYWSTVNDNVQTPLDGSNGYLWCLKTKKVIFEASPAILIQNKEKQQEKEEEEKQPAKPLIISRFFLEST